MSANETEKRRELDSLSLKFKCGTAQDEERLRLAIIAGELREKSRIDIVLRLTEDPNEQVRWYAVNSLARIDRSSEAVQIFWNIFEKDYDEEVRSMAIACIGTSLIGSLDKGAFMRLKTALTEESSPFLRRSLYDALLMVAAVQPSEWSSVKSIMSRQRDPHKFKVDWAKVAELEEMILRENP